MKTAHKLLTGTLLTATFAMPMTAFAQPSTDAADSLYQDDPAGLVDYKMGIVQMQDESSKDAAAAATASANVTGGPDGRKGLVQMKTEANAGVTEADAGTMGKMDGNNTQAAVPAEYNYKGGLGIAESKTAAQDLGSAKSKDGQDIGNIERVEKNGDTDTVYIRVSEKLDTPVSMFKVTVPASDLDDGVVSLPWTLSGLLDTLKKQQDA
ncbi:hypothetical protein [Thioclava sp. GXIMD4216]|uniref:hypothetical protein n=1 Tax=unclassified Thioclava TaxID=2621713 RepID=UPI0030CBB4A1